MAKLIYNKRKSHGNRSTPASGAGVDIIKVTIPNGEKFSHCIIEATASNSGAATSTIAKGPKVYATGKVEIKIMWTNGPWSKCSYKLKVYSKVTRSASPLPTTKPVVIFGSTNWYNLATGYITQKIPFKIRVEGPDAMKLINIIGPINTHLVRRRIVVNELASIAITGIICLTILGVVGLAVLGGLLLYAINQGCTTKAKYDTDISFSTNLAQAMEFDFDNCGR